MTNLHLAPIARSLARNKARSILTLSMTVLTFAVVVNSLMLIRDQQAQLTRESGFDDRHLVAIKVDNFDSSIDDDEQVIDRIKQDLEILQNTPGVIDAMSTSFRPWQGGGSSSTFTSPDVKDMEPVRAQFYAAGPNLANTLGGNATGAPLSVDQMYDKKAGEDPGAPADVVITRKLADEVFPGQDPHGKIITWSGKWFVRVVGVLDEFYNPYAWNIEERALFYPGYAGNSDSAQFLVRVDDALLGELARLEEVLLADNPQRGIRLDTVPEIREGFQANERLIARVLSIVIGLMVFITAVSIIGLTASSVAARRREIGTRRALGATRWEILRHFLLENAALTTLGLALGTGAAIGLNVLLVNAADVPRLTVPWVAVPAVAIAAVNVLAALQPARRASRVPPALATKAL